MSLHGTLATIPLPDLLQWAHGAGKHGCLSVESRGTRTRLWFDNGRVVACSSNDPPKLLGQFLLFHGVITEDALRQAMTDQSMTGLSLKKILVDAGYIGSRDLDEVVGEKAEETIFGLFDSEEGVFLFKEQAAPEPTAMDTDFQIQDLLLRGMARLDEQDRIQGRMENRNAVPVRTDRQPPPELFEEWPMRRIYGAIDGARSIEDIMLLVHGTEFQVTRRLFSLFRQGLIEMRPPKARAELPTIDAIASIDPRPERARTPDGTNAGVPISPFESLDLDLVRRLIDSGEHERALDILGAARRADPTDSAIRRLIVEATDALVSEIEDEGLSPTKVPVLVRSRESMPWESISSEEEYLLHLCDGTWTVQSLTWVASMQTIDVLRALRRLLDGGFIELRERPSAEATERDISRFARMPDGPGDSSGSGAAFGPG